MYDQLYAQIMYSGCDLRTKIVKDSGNSPNWNETFELYIASQISNELLIAIIDGLNGIQIGVVKLTLENINNDGKFLKNTKL